jgi:zinc transport system substrate-binding protein
VPSAARKEQAAHEHGHGQADPHIWLSPRLIIRQAGTIRDALGELDPGRQTVFDENLRAFTRELEQLDAQLSAELSGVRGRAFCIYHPELGYFAAAYGLRQIAVETEGKDPSPRELAALVRQARAERITAIFVQPQFSRTAAAALAREIGARVEEVDPLERDVPANLRRIASRLRAAMDGPP